MKTKSLIILVLVAVGFNCSAQNQKSSNAMETNKKVIRNLYENIINNQKINLLDEVISEEYSFGDKNGADAYKATVVPLFGAFPDIHFTIEQIFAEGDKVLVRWSWKGTNSGKFRHFEPSNKVITNTGNVIYQLKNGKVIHSWLEADRLGVLTQMGIIPESVTNPPKKK